MDIKDKHSTAKSDKPRGFWPRRRKMIVDEDGVATIEFVLWVPVFVLILALTVDSSIAFLTQSNMWNVTRDTARQMSTGLYTDAEGRSYALAQVSNWGKTPTVTTESTLSWVKVTMNIPMSDVVPFNIVGAFTSVDINTSLTQLREPE